MSSYMSSIMSLFIASDTYIKENMILRWSRLKINAKVRNFLYVGGSAIERNNKVRVLQNNADSFSALIENHQQNLPGLHCSKNDIKIVKRTREFKE